MVKMAISWYSTAMNLAKVFKKYASSDAFFYVTLDPERALGLEDVLPNYTIICPYKSQLTEKLKRVLVLEEHMSEGEVEKIVLRGTYGILKSDFIKKHIRDAHDREQDVYILILKNSQLIETLCEGLGWKLLAPKAKIAEKFENKISQYEALKNIVPYPKSMVATLSKLTGSDPVSYGARPRHKFVLQFNRGHSGNSTFFIESKEDLKKLAKKFPKRDVKISEYINGKTYTLNCLALQRGEILMGSLSAQITGLKRATNNPNTTCGNDFDSPKKLSKKTISAIREIAANTGKTLHKNKYKGLFGIDVIIENNTNHAYFIELNTHQPASISFEAKLHRKIEKMPLLAYFILDNLGYVPDPALHMPPIVLPISARQIIYRNKTDKILKYNDIKKKYVKKGFISRMKFIKPNEEIYRKQYISP